MREFVEVWLLVMLMKGSTHLQIHETREQCETTRMEIIAALPTKYSVENTKCMPVTKRRDYKVNYEKE
jgi:hypothetical protein